MKFVPVNTPLLNGNEKKYLIECIDTGWISSEGPFVKRFEEEFSNYVNRQYGTCVTNGTVALDIAVKALGIGPGDEVIVPSFTIISCASAVIEAGAIPVFVDCDETYNINVNLIEQFITDKTKAIMMAHIYGLTCDVDPILDLAKKYNLKVIEDAAEAHGQEYKGKKCGSFGDISIFSFYPNKHITTGEGGFLATDDKLLYERISSLRNLCFNNSQRFVHETLGTNARMTNMQAALGVAQLEKIEDKIIKKRKIGQYYNQALSCLNEFIELPIEKTDFCENIYWVYPIRLKSSVSMNAQEMAMRLGEFKIGTRPFFYPMHLQPCFKKIYRKEYDHFDVSPNFYQRGLYIPSGLGLDEDDMSYVVEKIQEILK